MSVRRESSTKSNNSTKFISIFIIVLIGVVALFLLTPKHPNATPTTQVELVTHELDQSIQFDKYTKPIIKESQEVISKEVR